MSNEILVHNSVVTISGESYTVSVFCRQDGHHFASTSLSEKDVIINDGPSLDDVLSTHIKLLPLALHSRKMVGEIKTYPLRTPRMKGAGVI